MSQLHELTGRDRRWIKGRLADRGVDAVDEDGRTKRYPARKALRAVFHTGDQDAPDAATEQALLNKAKRELAELELARERGDLVSVSDAETTTVALLSGLVTRLQAEPAGVAREVFGAGDVAEVAKILEDARDASLREIIEALEEAAAGKDQPAGRNRPKGTANTRKRRRDAAAARSEDAEPMGR